MSDKEFKDEGTPYYRTSAQQMQSYPAARAALAQFQAPVLIHAGNPHERLYVACFDGTGNDADKDPEHATNVARIYDQIKILKKSGNPQIAGDYVPGPGTQDGAVEGGLDMATGGTYGQRIEEMYARFIEQADKWHKADPNAEIRLADIGFSRGAEQAAGFARLVHERGIQDPSGAVYQRDPDNGMITGVRYTKPPLVAPGQVPQVEVLFDAVGTGEPYKHDRRPPPSVISGLHIIAQDERRDTFPSDRIIAPGQTPDGRFLGVTVAGAHADVGGGYRLDGLAVRNLNIATNYINSLSDTPFLQKSQEPDRTVVHSSEKAHSYDHWGTVDRSQRGGSNEWLVNGKQMSMRKGPYDPKAGFFEVKGTGEDPRHAQARDESLSNRFEWQPVRDAAAKSQERLPSQSAQLQGERATSVVQRDGADKSTPSNGSGSPWAGIRIPKDDFSPPQLASATRDDPTVTYNGQQHPASRKDADYGAPDVSRKAQEDDVSISR
jgi:hypothetical protein